MKTISSTKLLVLSKHTNIDDQLAILCISQPVNTSSSLTNVSHECIVHRIKSFTFQIRSPHYDSSVTTMSVSGSNYKVKGGLRQYPKDYILVLSYVVLNSQNIYEF